MQGNVIIHFFTWVEVAWPPPILPSPADDKDILPREDPLADQMLKIKVGWGLGRQSLLQLKGVCKSREGEMVSRIKCTALCLPKEHVSAERHVGVLVKSWRAALCQPSLWHLCRLGYSNLYCQDNVWDRSDLNRDI